MMEKIKIIKKYINRRNESVEVINQYCGLFSGSILVIAGTDFYLSYLNGRMNSDFCGIFKNNTRKDFFTINSLIDKFPQYLISGSRRCISRDEKYAVLSGILSDKKIYSGKISYNFISMLSAELSKLKSNFINCNLLHEPVMKNPDFNSSFILDLYKLYQKRLNENKLMDFEDKCVEILNSGALAKFICGYEAVIFAGVKNNSVFEIKLGAELILNKKRSLWVVERRFRPDAAQNLYYKSVLDAVKKTYDKSHIEIDEEKKENSRLCSYIDIDEKSGKKKLFSEKAAKKFYSIRYKNRFTEVEAIVRAVKYFNLKDGIPYSKIGIFVKNIDKYRHIFRRAFFKYNIPYVESEGQIFSETKLFASFASILKFISMPAPERIIEVIYNGELKIFTDIKNQFDYKTLGNYLAQSGIFDFKKLELDEINSKIQHYLVYLEKERTITEGLQKLFEVLKSFLSKFLEIFKPDADYKLFDFYNSVIDFISEFGFLADESAGHTSGTNRKILDYILRVLKSYIKNFAVNDSGLAFKIEEAADFFTEYLSQLRVPLKITGRDQLRPDFEPSGVMLDARGHHDFFDISCMFVCGITEDEFSGAADFNGFKFLNRNIVKNFEMPANLLELDLNRDILEKLFLLPSSNLFFTYFGAENNAEVSPSKLLMEFDGLSGEFNLDRFVMCDNDFETSAGPSLLNDNELKKHVESGFYSADFLNNIFIKTRRRRLCMDERNNILFGEYSGDISRSPRDKIIEKAFSPKDGVIKLSPTKLERYFTCPMLFFFEKMLGLKLAAPYEGEFDMLEEGELMHSVLQNFLADSEIIKLIKDCCESNEQAVGAGYKKMLEEKLFETGEKSLKAKTIGRFSKFYIEMKKYQYFNGLSGYNAGTFFSGLHGKSANGYFKNFMDDYFLFLKKQNVFIEPFLTEAMCEADISEINLSGNHINLRSKIDLIETINSDIEKTALITDYKFSAVPDSKSIKTYKKIQAFFYIYILNLIKTRKGSIITSDNTGAGKILNLADYDIAGFIYKSLTNYSGGSLKRRYFMNKNYVYKKNENEKDTALKISARTIILNKNEFDCIVNNTPDIIRRFIFKTAAGEFHRSVLESDDCERCSYKLICRRNSTLIKKIFKKDELANNCEVLFSGKIISALAAECGCEALISEDFYESGISKWQIS